MHIEMKLVFVLWLCSAVTLAASREKSDPIYKVPICLLSCHPRCLFISRSHTKGASYRLSCTLVEMNTLSHITRALFIFTLHSHFFLFYQPFNFALHLQVEPDDSPLSDPTTDPAFFASLLAPSEAFFHQLDSLLPSVPTTVPLDDRPQATAKGTSKAPPPPLAPKISSASVPHVPDVAAIVQYLFAEDQPLPTPARTALRRKLAEGGPDTASLLHKAVDLLRDAVALQSHETAIQDDFLFIQAADDAAPAPAAVEEVQSPSPTARVVFAKETSGAAEAPGAGAAADAPMVQLEFAAAATPSPAFESPTSTNALSNIVDLEAPAESETPAPMPVPSAARRRRSRLRRRLVDSATADLIAAPLALHRVLSGPRLLALAHPALYGNANDRAPVSVAFADLVSLARQALAEAPTDNAHRRMLSESEAPGIDDVVADAPSNSNSLAEILLAESFLEGEGEGLVVVLSPAEAEDLVVQAALLAAQLLAATPGLGLGLVGLPVTSGLAFSGRPEVAQVLFALPRGHALVVAPEPLQAPFSFF